MCKFESNPWIYARIYYFGIMHALIFTGYNVINSFLVIVYPDHAFISFSIYYGLFAIGNLIITYLYDKMNFTLSLLLSSIGFLCFIGMCSSNNSILMLIGSAICGIANSFIRLCQFIGLNKDLDMDEGMVKGIFFTLFNTSIIFGNIIGMIVLLTGASIFTMMWIMMIPTGIGVIMTLFISYFYKTDDMNREINEFTQLIEEDKKTISQDIGILSENIGILRHIKKVLSVSFTNNKNGFLLMNVMINQSLGVNIIYLILPKLLVLNADNISADQHTMALYNILIFLGFGIFSTLFSILWGKIYDKYGWKLVVFPYFFLEIVTLIMIFVMGKIINKSPLFYWAIFGSLYGIINSGQVNMVSITISITYIGHEKYMFAFYQFVFAVSYVLFSILIEYIEFQYILLMAGIISLISVISFYYFIK